MKRFLLFSVTLLATTAASAQPPSYYKPNTTDVMFKMDTHHCVSFANGVAPKPSIPVSKTSTYDIQYKSSNILSGTSAGTASVIQRSSPSVIDWLAYKINSDKHAQVVKDCLLSLGYEEIIISEEHKQKMEAAEAEYQRTKNIGRLWPLAYKLPQKIYSSPESETNPSFTLRRPQTLFVKDETSDKYLVETQDGKTGWVTKDLFE